MRAKLHRDEVEIDEVFFAAYAFYLGYPVMKCASSSTTVWTFLIPSCDLEILREEFASADTSMFVKPFVNALKHVYETQNLARQYCGEYLTPQWKRATRR